MKKVLLVLVLLLPGIVFATGSVDINSASLEQLDSLAGIGATYAQRIIDGRPYTLLDDLLKVKGIGEKTLQKIKDQGLACVDCTAQSNVQDAPPTNVTNSQPAEISAENSGGQGYATGVYINEVLANPAGADEEEEWFELYNSNSSEVNLSGWKAEDILGAKTTYVFAEGLKIAPNGYLVLKRPETKITLNNTEDGLLLLWPNGETEDSVNYTSAPKGQSYNKTNLGWELSNSPTPGSQNVIAVPKSKVLASSNKSNQEALPNLEKSGNNNEVEAQLAALNPKTNNPWFLFFAALAITIISALAVLFIKLKLNNNVRT